jgi:polysaccharide deacetylase 2 family uncharacterized protein YibQ
MNKQKYIVIAIVVTMLFLSAGSYGLVWYSFKQKQLKLAQIEAEKVIIEEITLSAPEPINPVDKLLETSVPRFVMNAAVTESIPSNHGKIAIILDDLGLHETIWPQLESLPPAITYSYLPYGKHSVLQANLARKTGHEIMIHLPMEPHPTPGGTVIDPGPDALYTELTTEEIIQRTHKNLDALKEVSVAVNNHMGSKFSEYEEGLTNVLSVVKDEKLFFLDSVTTAHSAIPKAAQNVDIPLLKRDIFIDHSQELEDIQAMLLKLEEVAKKQGSVIAIGHPHGTTLKALEMWIPTLAEKNLSLVPITNLLEDKLNQKPEQDTFYYAY